ncbi:regulatory signaling modulator protein AmpE [Atopomonas sediminilitoris]|uniref:regulatory signaling modulator protein AmpE n=1 Tax=Atopomonas sediminilitoris TaxID=2919919 RepID=UPI001F4DFF29|nr:regulatory signaling modulator protein AmpE [Atopomonas sediminilitoris]
MSFVILVLVVVLEKFSAWRKVLQRDGLWWRWHALAAASEQQPWLRLLLLLALPLGLLSLLLWLAGQWFYGVLLLPLELVVVLYALGRGEIPAALGGFRDAWRRGDVQGAAHAAERDLGLDEHEDAAGLFAGVQSYLLWQAFQGFFVIVFWYALLGPVVVLGYRLLALLAEHKAQPALSECAQALRHGLDWLPVRLLATSFALVGNFTAVMAVLLHELLGWDTSAQALLAKCGRVADEQEQEAAGTEGLLQLDSLWHLLVRSATLWMAVLAVLTLLW